MFNFREFLDHFSMRICSGLISKIDRRKAIRFLTTALVILSKSRHKGAILRQQDSKRPVVFLVKNY